MLAALREVAVASPSVPEEASPEKRPAGAATTGGRSDESEGGGACLAKRAARRLVVREVGGGEGAAGVEGRASGTERWVIAEMSMFEG